MEPDPRLDVQRPWRMVSPDIDLLTYVGPVVGVLGTLTFPAAEVARVALVDQQLLLGRQREEIAHRGEDPIHELLRDRMVDQQEEAELVADPPDLFGERDLVGLAPLPTAEVHHGERIGG